MADTKIIGVIAIKGGVGKTTTVCNLGAVLAHRFDKKVLVVDGNFSAPNLALHLGIVNPETSLHDVLKGHSAVEDAIYDLGDGLHILPASLLPKGKTDYFKLKKTLDGLREYYDVILIDSSPNLNSEILSTMDASDELLVVSTPDYPTLSCTMHAVKVAKSKKTPITGLILNRVYNKKFELSLDEIEDAAETPVLAVLPHDVKLVQALSLTTPAVNFTPKSEVVTEYSKLAGALVGESYKDTRLFKKLMGTIRKNPPKQDVNRDILRQR